MNLALWCIIWPQTFLLVQNTHLQPIALRFVRSFDNIHVLFFFKELISSSIPTFQFCTSSLARASMTFTRSSKEFAMFANSTKITKSSNLFGSFHSLVCLWWTCVADSSDFSLPWSSTMILKWRSSTMISKWKSSTMTSISWRSLLLCWFSSSCVSSMRSFN